MDESKREASGEVALTGRSTTAHCTTNQRFHDECNRHEQRADEWIGYCRGLLTLVDTAGSSFQSLVAIARYVASHDLPVFAALSVLRGDTDRERGPEFSLATLVHRRLCPVGRVPFKQFSKSLATRDDRKNERCGLASASMTRSV